MNHFESDQLTALEAPSEAHSISFAPVVFQVSRVLRGQGILELMEQGGAAGKTLDELVSESGLPRYGTKILLESGLGIGLLCLKNARFSLTKLNRPLMGRAAVGS